MIEDHDKWQKTTSGIQALVVSCAVLIGGCWTLYTFRSQRHIENAEAQLQKLNRELEAEARLELALNIKTLGTGEPYTFTGNVSVKNVGNKMEVLRFSDPPLHLYRLSVDPKGETWEKVRSFDVLAEPGVRLGGMSCAAGATNNAAFAFSVDSPGKYLLRFAAPRSSAETERAVSYGALEAVPERKDIEWAASTYFVTPDMQREP